MLSDPANVDHNVRSACHRPVIFGNDTMTGAQDEPVQGTRRQGLRRAASQILVIDFGPYFAAETGALERLAAELGDACENIGFFYALGRSLDAPANRTKSATSHP